jgi:hypothetical protein
MRARCYVVYQYAIHLGGNPRFEVKRHAQLDKARSFPTERTLGPVRVSHIHLPTSVIRRKVKLARVETTGDLEDQCSG